MAGINATVRINDGMSPALKSMNKALSIVLKNFDALQKSTGSAIDVAEIEEAKEELRNTARAIDTIEDNLRKAEEKQQKFNDSVKNGEEATNNLQDSIAKVVAVLGGMAVINKVTDFVGDCTDAFNTQLNAANQLRTVLANMVGSGAEESFKALNQKASSIQSEGMYGDEVMLAGAAELSTYFTDTDAIKMMMDTLADYTAGMTGGGAVDSAEMVGYATGLGKIVVGSYDAMNEKGFEFTDTQKAIIEGTASEADIVNTLGEEYLKLSSDMQTAAVISQVIGESWEGLYESMSNTPEGKIISLKNTLGDIEEKVAAKLYPVILKLIGYIENNMPEIEAALDGLADVLAGIIDFVAGIFDFVANNKELVVSAIEAITIATIAWKVAQIALNTAMNVNPIFLVITAIIFLITIIYNAIKSIGDIELAWLIFCDAFWTATEGLGGIVLMICQDILNIFVDMINGIIEMLNWIPGVSIDLIGQLTFGDDALLENELLQAERAAEIQAKREELNAAKVKAEEDPFAEYYTPYSDVIGSDISDIADNTDTITDALEITEEDLKYLRDIAEQEAVNRFTTAEIKIDMQNNNSINSNMDIDGIVTQLEDKLYESMTIAAEGVY